MSIARASCCTFTASVKKIATSFTGDAPRLLWPKVNLATTTRALTIIQVAPDEVGTVRRNGWVSTHQSFNHLLTRGRTDSIRADGVAARDPEVVEKFAG